MFCDVLIQNISFVVVVIVISDEVRNGRKLECFVLKHHKTQVETSFVWNAVPEEWLESVSIYKHFLKAGHIQMSIIWRHTAAHGGSSSLDVMFTIGFSQFN